MKNLPLPLILFCDSKMKQVLKPPKKPHITSKPATKLESKSNATTEAPEKRYKAQSFSKANVEWGKCFFSMKDMPIEIKTASQKSALKAKWSIQTSWRHGIILFGLYRYILWSIHNINFEEIRFNQIITKVWYYLVCHGYQHLIWSTDFFRFLHEKLEVNPEASDNLDFGNIINTNLKTKSTSQQKKGVQDTTDEEQPDEDFIDDPDVPPLI